MTERSAGTHLWLVLMKAHRTLAQHAEQSIVALEMCLSDFGTLELLLHKGPQKPSEIGRKINLTSGAVTTAVDRLESRFLVTRAFDGADRRTRVVSLTPQGKAVIGKVFAAHAAAMESATSGLTRKEQATLTQLLKKLGTTAEQQLTEEPSRLTQTGART
jgi:MarR family 2-MHQ and catechol resistance regulon transcriptional repressor